MLLQGIAKNTNMQTWNNLVWNGKAVLVALDFKRASILLYTKLNSRMSFKTISSLHQCEISDSVES